MRVVTRVSLRTGAQVVSALFSLCGTHDGTVACVLGLAAAPLRAAPDDGEHVGDVSVLPAQLRQRLLLSRQVRAINAMNVAAIVSLQSRCAERVVVCDGGMGLVDRRIWC